MTQQEALSKFIALVKEIPIKEAEFKESPDLDKALALYEMWSDYISLVITYLGAPCNLTRAYERLDFYGNWQPQDGAALLCLYDFEPGEVILNVKDGQIVNLGSLADYIEDVITENGMPASCKVRLKVSVEYVEGVTCALCPKFESNCFSSLCPGARKEEWDARYKKCIEAQILFMKLTSPIT